MSCQPPKMALTGELPYHKLASLRCTIACKSPAVSRNHESFKGYLFKRMQHHCQLLLLLHFVIAVFHAVNGTKKASKSAGSAAKTLARIVSVLAAQQMSSEVLAHPSAVLPSCACHLVEPPYVMLFLIRPTLQKAEDSARHVCVHAHAH